MKKLFLFSIILFTLLPQAIVFSFSENEKKYPLDNTPKIILKIGDKTEEVPTEQSSLWLEIQPQMEINKKYVSRIENIDFCPNEKIICQKTMLERSRIHFKVVEKIIPKEKNIRDFLEDLTRKINRDPIDSKFEIQDGKVSVFSLSQNGIRLDVDESLNEIINEIEQRNGDPLTINLSYEEIIPNISSQDVNNLGIISLIGEGRSNFSGSPKNRIFNIKVATSRFNGILIKPGEEFSFVQILGPVDEEHGYKSELVIKKDKTEPEFGGGICQVSTTAFRAAINTGLKITARKNHAYPVKYYNPQGTDATIYVPRPDLKFTNNTPGHILIQTEIVGTELIFKFYGTNDGRKIETIGPKVIEKNPDGSMKTTFGQKVYDASGNIIIDDVFNSSYDSPDKYPHPGDALKEKPKDWSSREWDDYKKTHNI